LSVLIFKNKKVFKIKGEKNVAIQKKDFLTFTTRDLETGKL